MGGYCDAIIALRICDGTVFGSLDQNIDTRHSNSIFGRRDLTGNGSALLRCKSQRKQNHSCENPK